MATCRPGLLLLHLQVAVLLLAGLSVASAALPKHPFFGSVQAGAKDYHYDDYGKKLCLQTQKACYDGVPCCGGYGGYDFAISVGCCSDGYHYHGDSMLDLTLTSAGWCVFTHDWTYLDIPDLTLTGWGVSTFEAQCFLHSNSPDCDLQGCENAVVHVTGVVLYQDGVVFDSNYVPAEGCPCYDDHIGKGSAMGDDGPVVCIKAGSEAATNGTRQNMRRGEWVKNLRERLGKAAPAKRDAADKITIENPGPHALYEADAFMYYGIATTYSSSGKLIGTGPFEYTLPCVEDPDEYEDLTYAQAGDRKRYSPFDIKTNVQPITTDGHHSR